MAKEEAERFEVVITPSAEIHYYNLHTYLYENMSVNRAEEVANEILAAAFSLDHLHHRGAKEPLLKNRKRQFRFILYKRTERAAVKIIYHVDEKSKTVFVTDFFPTEMNPKKISRRSQ